MLKGHNQADLSGRRAADAVANLQHLALVARQEERYKWAVIALGKARQRGKDGSEDEDADGDSSSVSDGGAYLRSPGLGPFLGKIPVGWGRPTGGATGLAFPPGASGVQAPYL